MTLPKTVLVKRLFDGRRLERNVFFELDKKGVIRSRGSKKPQKNRVEEEIDGICFPALVNAHSHAFQYAMAGEAEYSSDPKDDFWSWREKMYQTASRISPKELEEVARKVYSEMICAGYGWVCEFHYLHHRPDGTKFDDNLAMSKALLRAAEKTGIGMTLLPTFYFREGGFEDTRRRFASKSPLEFVALWKNIDAHIRKFANPRVRLGVAFHSLRASTLDSIRFIDQALPAEAVRHIHIAEQSQEIELIEKEFGKRAVDYLLSGINVTEKWSLVHATHVSNKEIARIVESGATVVLCPSTEANLGDGFFPVERFHGKGSDALSSFSIGSDSHVGIDPIGELRWLDYGARLRLQKRNPLVFYDNISSRKSGTKKVSDQSDQDWRVHSAGVLLAGAIRGGGRSAGCSAALQVGDFFDLLQMRNLKRTDQNDLSMLGAAVFHSAPSVQRTTYLCGQKVTA